MDREASLENINMDYGFLRSNRVSAKTALRMVGMAYAEEEKTEYMVNGLKKAILGVVPK